MGYERDEAMRQQEATEAMIRMREPRRPSEGPFMPCPAKVTESKGSTERVPFRLIQTPCCGQLLCWVNPRLPNCCPECGTRIYPQVRSCVLVHDEQATLRTTEYVVTTRKARS